ncbi:MAG: hypothetical protein ABIR59_07580 [Gemmatimonadales bacterium]
MTDDRLHDDLILSEDQFREIIERATRMERNDDGVSVTILRQVADELGIEATALERALGDVVGLPDSKRPVRGWMGRTFTKVCRVIDQILPRKGRLLAGMFAGASLGWLSAHIAVGLQRIVGGFSATIGSSSFIDVPVAAALIALTLANSLSRRYAGGFGRYCAETLAIWGAFGAAWTITSGAPTSDLMTWVAIATGASMMWGWLIIPRNAPGQRIAPLQQLRSLVTSTGRRDTRIDGPVERSAWRAAMPWVTLELSLRHARGATSS